MHVRAAHVLLIQRDSTAAYPTRAAAAAAAAAAEAEVQRPVLGVPHITSEIRFAFPAQIHTLQNRFKNIRPYQGMKALKSARNTMRAGMSIHAKSKYSGKRAPRRLACKY